MVKKIEKKTEEVGITLDSDSHEDMLSIMKSSDVAQFVDTLPEDSFRQLFWAQQFKAATQKNARNMRWHPLMIRWCLSLRHRFGCLAYTLISSYSRRIIIIKRRSSGAYELLRDSGCIKLPTQQTLRDYTHYVAACTGFSSDVDKMLIHESAAMTCPEREKYVMLLIDEMHIKQDLVFDKHTGKLIGYTNLGDINNHLIDYEQSLTSASPAAPKFAKTMLVFMVRGLFNSMQFAYAQLPAASLSGDLLYEPFWEAVERIERCGLKVNKYLAIVMQPE